MSRPSICAAVLAGALSLVASPGTSAATFTVTTLADGGAGSLRDAVAQANANPGANTVNFSVNGTITLTSGSILISKGPLTIDGPGVGNLTVDGNFSSRIFTIIDSSTPVTCPDLTGPADYQVIIRHMTLAHARRNVADSSGGAIFTAHSLTVDDMSFVDNAAKSGGAISFRAQYADQALSVTRSSFTGNAARPVLGGNTGSYAGGAISAADYCGGTRTATLVAISDSLFEDNYVAPDNLQGLGGAISAFDGTFLTVTRSRIVFNRIDRPNPPGAFSYPGGGIAATHVTISNSEISGNLSHHAGGVLISQNDSTLQTEAGRVSSSITNSTIWGNTATQDGGGVEAFGNVDVTIANSTIADNTAIVGAAGGVLTGRSAGAYLDPRLSLYSSILSGSQLPNKSDLYNFTGNTPAINVTVDHSIIETVCALCGITVNNVASLINVDPLLGPPSANGGTLIAGAAANTMPLLLNSPAKDAGSNPFSQTTDQRGAGFPRSVGAAVDMGAMEGVGYCSGMTDVASDNAFCANVDWLRNRGVTLGCTTTAYCPADPVTRAQMAIFMNRLGAALSPTVLDEGQDLGAWVVPEVGNIKYVCVTDAVVDVPYRRAALVSGRVNGLADGPVSWRSSLWYSVDDGVNWLPTSTQVGMRGYAGTGEWTMSATDTVFQLARGLEYRFAIGVNRDDQVTGLTGNFSDSTCNLVVRVVNRNATTAPF